MTAEGHKMINSMVEEEIEYKILETINNCQAHLWSDDDQKSGELIFKALEKILNDWGFKISTEQYSMIRTYPKNMYKIAMEMISAEQLIINILVDIESTKLSERIGLSEEQLSKLQIMEKQDINPGVRVFKAVQALSLSRKTIFANWLKENNKLSASELFSDLYSGKYSDLDVCLTEQVLFHIIKNPLLLTGEGMKINSDWGTHYAQLQEELTLLGSM